jgi:hypothetical protein
MKSVSAWAWLLGLATLCFAALAVSNESLWLDEAQTAYKATQPDFGSFRAALEEDAGSDLNMPFYMVFMWLWDKVAGSRPEWLLRAPNLLWFALLQIGLFAALRSRPRIACWTLLVGAVSPFIWFYLDEARPYVMQLAGAGLVTAFFVRRLDGMPAGTVWTYSFAAGLLLLCGSSMLGVLWVGSALALLAWLAWRGEIVLGRGDRMVLGGTLGLLTILGTYFFRNIFFVPNSKPTPGATGFLNVAFSLYELLGAAGLGPSRAAIRDAGLAAFKPYLLSVIVGGTVMGGLVLSGATAFLRKDRRVFLTFFAAWVVPCVTLFALGHLSHARLLGRHFTPALPPLLLLTAWMLARLAPRPRGRLVAGAAIFLYLASATSLRFAGRHAKDGNRAALTAAGELLATGKDVWWVNDHRVLHYYGIPSHEPHEPGAGVTRIRNPSEESLQRLTAPDAVFLSRPDIFDESGNIEKWLAAAAYVPTQPWPGFTVWRKPQ